MRIMRRKGNKMRVSSLQEARSELLDVQERLWCLRDILLYKLHLGNESLEIEFLDRALSALGSSAYAVLCTIQDRD